MRARLQLSLKTVLRVSSAVCCLANRLVHWRNRLHHRVQCNHRARKALSIREKVSGKPAVAFSSGGGSSDAALASLERMIGSFRLEKVADGVVSHGEPSGKDLEACKKLGEALAARALERAEPPRD